MQPLTTDAPHPPEPRSPILAYVEIARIDHWFKNAFVVLGTLAAWFYAPQTVTLSALLRLGATVFFTCIVASSNYVVNELLDGPTDKAHPVKRSRPVPSGRVKFGVAIVEWLALGAIGVGALFHLELSLGLSGLWLWTMGVVYNVSPLRTKDVPYFDVLTESINNPIRLLLGWYAVIPTIIPPISLIVAYWMAGAFFMATKRFGEYRRIGDRDVASAYRKSFAHYTEERLLVSMVYYVAAAMLAAGVFIVRYRVELILAVPLIAGFFAFYFKLGLLPDSPVQNPEKLYKQRGFLGIALLTVGALILLMFVHIPAMYRWFDVAPAGASALWHIGSRPDVAP